MTAAALLTGAAIFAAGMLAGACVERVRMRSRFREEYDQRVDRWLRRHGWRGLESARLAGDPEPWSGSGPHDDVDFPIRLFKCGDPLCRDGQPGVEVCGPRQEIGGALFHYHTAPLAEALAWYRSRLYRGPR